MPRIKGKRNSFSFISLGIILMLISSASLSADQGVVYKETRPLKNIFDVKKEGETTSKADTEGNYIYDPRGKTDPFKSFIAVRQEKEAKEKKKPKTYLETLDLSQLSLSVIVIGPKGKWAMVKDPKGLGHVIREGTAIGTNSGTVYKIQTGEVIIREEYQDFRGKKQFRDVSKKPPGER